MRRSRTRSSFSTLVFRDVSAATSSCDYCQTPQIKHTCWSCDTAGYCSRRCQKADLYLHEVECSVVRVHPVVDDPMPGVSRFSAVVTERCFVDQITKTSYKVSGREVLEKYFGKEQEMVLKVQIACDPAGQKTKDSLWVYDRERDFKVYIKHKDENFWRVKNSVERKGIECFTPGKKQYFRCRLNKDFSLDIFVNDIIDGQSW